MTIATTNQDALPPSMIRYLVNHLISTRSPDGSPKPMVAPFIWGPPGVGKTELVRSLARERGSRLVALHLLQYDPTDLRGIPIRTEDGRVMWYPSSYLPATKVFNVRSEKDKLRVNFPYAENIAVYLFDQDGNKIGYVNDPVHPDMIGSGVELVVERLNPGEWLIHIDRTTDRPIRVEVEDKAILFLDELSSAETSTQNAALQLVLDRRVGEYDLPSSVPVIAAGNRETDGAFVQPFSHTLGNRFEHLTIRADANDWIEWAITAGIRPEIIGMIKWRPESLFQYDDKIAETLTDGNYGFRTPRTWTMLSQQYANFEFFENAPTDAHGNVVVSAKQLRMSMFSGLIGRAGASEFIGFLEVMHELPHPLDIMAGTATEIGDVERSKTFGLLYALISHFKNCYDQNFVYNENDPLQEQSSDWTGPRDNILRFVARNYSPEMGSWMTRMLSSRLKVEPVSLLGEAFDEYATVFGATHSRSVR